MDERSTGRSDVSLSPVNARKTTTLHSCDGVETHWSVRDANQTFLYS